MNKPVIKIENLSKVYRLGEVGTGTLSHDLNRFWQINILGREDPYSKVGQINDRTQKAQKGEHISALRDINLEVQQGEVLGIIGKNGAGKSTLLKLLSRITSPTTGSIRIKGRLAALLEVGTGFHPEMTGRENIYMNGTIMGMRKWEIDHKLEEIVEFAGVAKYIDTPTKRYSSGMTVRLGFSIAAHLEPEILLVDEVLAVGDAEFQKKAIGKMQDVSTNKGRTVLFVSHNMASVQKLCTHGVLLENGTIALSSNINDVINHYISTNSRPHQTSLLTIKRKSGLGLDVKLTAVKLINSNNDHTNVLKFGEPFSFIIGIASHINKDNLNIGIRFETYSEIYIASCLSGDKSVFYNINKGDKKSVVSEFRNFYLSPGSYKITLSIRDGKRFLDQVVDAISFSVENIAHNPGYLHNGAWGLVNYIPNWE